MMGYLLSSATLKDHTILPDIPSHQSSLEQIHQDSGESLENLVRGPHSIGAFLQNAGYDTVPSPTNKDPTGGAYYSGGYNTRRLVCTTSSGILNYHLPFLEFEYRVILLTDMLDEA